MFLLNLFSKDLFNPTTTVEVAFFIFGGLGIFLFGLSLMSDSLKNIAGSRLKSYIEKATNTPVKAVFTGILITILLQSSSGTTALVVSLITAGLMTFPQAIGVIMGSNIGTTFTAFLIGLKIEQFALPIITIGAVLIFFTKRKKANLFGFVMIGFGMLFFGLQIMGAGFSVLTQTDWFKSVIASISDVPVLGVIVGALLTAAVQSSSAFIGVLQQLYSEQAVPILVALMMLMGSNIGTTITTTIASISGNRQAKQAAMSHLLFNIVGTIIFAALIMPAANLFSYIEATILQEPGSRMTLALAHISFNLVTTIILIFFVKQIVWLVEKVLPTQTVSTSLNKLNIDLLNTSPVLALTATKECIIEMGEVAKKMLVSTQKYLNENNHEHFDKSLEYENLIDLYNHEIHDYLMQMETNHLDVGIGLKQVIYLDTIMDFERIGDHCVNLVEFFEDRYNTNVETDTTLLDNLNYFFKQVELQIENAVIAFSESSKEKAKSIIKLEEEIDTLERRYRNIQLSMIGDGILSLKDIHYVDILSNLERISDHCVNIARNVIDPHYISRT